MKVKICGVRTAEDAGHAVAAGADAIGANFHPGSKRFVPLDQAESWLRALEGRTLRVGVSVDVGRDELMRLWASGALDALQLHGSESPDLCTALLAEGIPLIKAFALSDASVLDSIADYPAQVDVLIDAFVPGQHGGTGRLADWTLARECVLRFPGRRIYLSGGLTPDNVADAIRAVRPHAVDVASGVESSPGVKDARLVTNFVANAATAKNSTAKG